MYISNWWSLLSIYYLLHCLIEWLLFKIRWTVFRGVEVVQNVEEGVSFLRRPECVDSQFLYVWGRFQNWPAKKSFGFKHILLLLNLMISLIFLAFMLKLKIFLIFLPTFVRTPAQVRPYATNDSPSIRLVIKIGYKLSVMCKNIVIFFLHEPLCPKGELLCSISISWSSQVQSCASHVSY
jgi:hypothetical protein